MDELTRILKEALEVAGAEADNVFANVKNKCGEKILSIDEKLEKYTETTHISLLGFLECLIWQLAGFLKLLPKFDPFEILSHFVRDKRISLAP